MYTCNASLGGRDSGSLGLARWSRVPGSVTLSQKPGWMVPQEQHLRSHERAHIHNQASAVRDRWPLSVWIAHLPKKDLCGVDQKSRYGKHRKTVLEPWLLGKTWWLLPPEVRTFVITHRRYLWASPYWHFLIDVVEHKTCAWDSGLYLLLFHHQAARSLPQVPLGDAGAQAFRKAGRS